MNRRRLFTALVRDDQPGRGRSNPRVGSLIVLDDIAGRLQEPVAEDLILEGGLDLEFAGVREVDHDTTGHTGGDCKGGATGRTGGPY